VTVIHGGAARRLKSIRFSTAAQNVMMYDISVIQLWNFQICCLDMLWSAWLVWQWCV